MCIRDRNAARLLEAAEAAEEAAALLRAAAKEAAEEANDALLAAIREGDDDVGVFGSLERSSDAKLFHVVFGLTKTGSIADDDLVPTELERHL